MGPLIPPPQIYDDQILDKIRMYCVSSYHTGISLGYLNVKNMCCLFFINNIYDVIFCHSVIPEMVGLQTPDDH